MTRSHPPAAEMSPDDLLELCAEVGRDPALSYDLAGSREHIEAVCRLAVNLSQDRADLIERNTLHELARERLGKLASKALAAREVAERDNRALQERIAALTNERDALAVQLDQARNAWQADVLLRDAAEGRREDAETCAQLWQVIADRALVDAKRVPAEQLVVDAGLDLSRELVRERARHAKTQAELAKALRRLEEQQRTRALNDQIRGAFARAVHAICDGVTVEDLNHQLDEELAAHPDPGPLHHARGQREQDGGL